MIIPYKSLADDDCLLTIAEKNKIKAFAKWQV